MSEIVYRAPDWKSPETFRRVTAIMTNWENTIWSREKYPGLKDKDATAIVKMFPRIARCLAGYAA